MATAGISRKLPVPRFLYRLLFPIDVAFSRWVPQLLDVGIALCLERSAPAKRRAPFCVPARRRFSCSPVPQPIFDHAGIRANEEVVATGKESAVE